jgi:hypothetical protein
MTYYEKTYDTESSFSSINFNDLETKTIKLVKSLHLIRQLSIGNEMKKSMIKLTKKEILDLWEKGDIYIPSGVTRDVLTSLSENYDKMYGTNYYVKLFDKDDSYSVDSSNF